MGSFRFSLQRILDWRRTQLEREEAAFKRETAALACIDHRRAELDASASLAEMRIRQSAEVTGVDLAALGGFRLAVRQRAIELTAERAAQTRKLSAQAAAMLEARRRLRLLEKLKERRSEAWRAAEGRELESLASESFLSQWARRRVGER